MLNRLKKMRLLTLAGVAVVLVSASGTTSLAEDTNASPTAAAAPAASHTPTASAAASPTSSGAASAATPTLEQRVAGLEAYVTNGDPTAPLKDKDGNIPKDLTMATVGTPGPGHNGWMMTSSALVLF